MPMDAQTRLLRVLQQGEYTTVGGRTPIKTDVRIVAATNKDLKILINQGLFREDLYYRLNVVPLRLPALRDRAEDVPDLVRHFVRHAVGEGLDAKRFDGEALELLKAYPWPGNVRELENVVRRVMALYPQDVITREIIDNELRIESPEPILAARVDLDGAGNHCPVGGREHAPLFRRASARICHLPDYTTVCLEEVEYPLILAALTATRGNQIKAADLLGLNRNTLRKKIRELGVTVYRSPRPV
jgi:two-component system nitrogen regulation response regulator GlnG